MPHLRAIADKREPGSSLRRVSFVVRAGAWNGVRSMRAAAAWIISRTGAAAALSCLPEQEVCVDRARSFAWSAESPCVALLPHLQAGKLTICASYW
jgi:hypothetical protein